MADERELLVAFAEWYGQAYAANFIPKGTIDAFLAARQPPSEPYPPRSEPIGPPSVAACVGCLNRATYCHACYHAPALDQWLAARQPPGEPAAIIQCPACGESFVRDGDEGKLLPAALEAVLRDPDVRLVGEDEAARKAIDFVIRQSHEAAALVYPDDVPKATVSATPPAPLCKTCGSTVEDHNPPPDPLCTWCGHPRSAHGATVDKCCAPDCLCVAWRGRTRACRPRRSGSGG